MFVERVKQNTVWVEELYHMYCIVQEFSIAFIIIIEKMFGRSNTKFSHVNIKVNLCLNISF